MSFDCDRCGACCRNIRLSTFYDKDLDRGDGVCKHLTADNLCAIYKERPLICNVDAYYEKLLTGKMPREDFYKLNYEACERLKSLTRQSNRDIVKRVKLGAE